ncbi:hypothetical protein [Carboxylicivirga taeanensis]|uniref:hypothetical protein n=1 Tax=Carboxylicivirga taeanensis TaxID=1416875 RepID=UPI003F6DB3E7
MNRLYKMGRFFITLNSVFALILLVSSCQKKAFTEPVVAQLVVTMASGDLPQISFESAGVYFEQIVFDGHRQTGGDVHFATEPDKSIGPVYCTGNTVGAIKEFDIPQGVYTHMEWRFILGDMSEAEDDADVEEESDIEGGIVISGLLNKQDGTSVPVKVIIEDEEELLIKTIAETGYQDITLLATDSYEIQLVIDPYYAMRPISLESWENAELNDDDEAGYIEISSDMNEELYEMVLVRLESSVKALIK